MYPVAKHSRAGLRLVILCRALMLASSASVACAHAAEAPDAIETVFQGSLKPGTSKQVFGSPFRYDEPDEGDGAHRHSLAGHERTCAPRRRPSHVTDGRRSRRPADRGS